MVPALSTALAPGIAPEDCVPMAETDRPELKKDEHADLARLGSALSEAEQRKEGEARRLAEREAAATGSRRSLGRAWSLAIEMVAAVGVSVFIGWWVDRWLQSTPFGVVGFALLGVATAMWTAIRTGMAMNREAESEGGKEKGK